MPNNNYRRGRAFEYKTKRLLEAAGWFVVRAAGSKGPADLVAIRAGWRPLLVQCKLGRCSDAERDKLFKLADLVDANAGLISPVSGHWKGAEPCRP